MKNQDHNKILRKIIKPIFNEYGIKQKGQSRIWLDDKYWYTVVIEFQPSTRSKGTYLNIGVNFNWYLQQQFSFDIGYRETEFCEFLNEKQFSNELENLGNLAATKASEFHRNLMTLEQATDTIGKSNFVSDEVWGNYHKGVIYGLQKNWEGAKKHLSKLMLAIPEYQWIKEIQISASKLQGFLETNKFEEEVNLIIEKTRLIKKLPEMERRNVWE